MLFSDSLQQFWPALMRLVRLCWAFSSWHCPPHRRDGCGVGPPHCALLQCSALTSSQVLSTAWGTWGLSSMTTCSWRCEDWRCAGCWATIGLWILEPCTRISHSLLCPCAMGLYWWKRQSLAVFKGEGGGAARQRGGEKEGREARPAKPCCMLCWVPPLTCSAARMRPSLRRSSSAFCCLIPVWLCCLVAAVLDKATLLWMVKLGRAKHSVVPKKENCSLSRIHPRTFFLGLALLDPSELEEEKSCDSLHIWLCFCIRGCGSSRAFVLLKPVSSVSSAHAHPSDSPGKQEGACSCQIRLVLTRSEEGQGAYRR